MWYKLILLLLYFIFLFALARVLEIVSWCGGGISQKFLDPMSLSVSRLKALLETRGVSYDGAVEKQDLAELVEASGVTSDMDTTIEVDGDDVVTNFSHGLHFLEEVEDKKDSVWLVQIKTDHWPDTLLGELKWKAVRKKLSMFGIRAGVFDCQFDQRLCSMKGWTTPRLVLALPQDFTNKATVTLSTYHGPTQVRHIIHWVKENMATRITDIKNTDDFQKNWLTFSDDKSSEIRVILFAKFAILPLFFSALSFKFPGRVRFGLVSHKSTQQKTMLKKIGEYKVPSYVIIKRGRSYLYGVRPGELLTFVHMERFLTTLYPEINDIFLSFLFISNWLSWLEFVLCRGGFTRRVVRLVWYLIKYNVIVIVSLLPIIGLFRLPYMDYVVSFGLQFLQKFGMSFLACLLRKDVALFCTDAKLFLAATGMFSLCVFLIEYIRWRGTEEPTSNHWDFSQFMTSSYLMSPFMQISPIGLSVYSGDVDRSFELINEHMNNPSLWLRPSVDPVYIKELPTWTYQIMPETSQIQHPCCNQLDHTTRCICDDNYVNSRGIGLGYCVNCKKSNTNRLALNDNIIDNISSDVIKTMAVQTRHCERCEATTDGRNVNYCPKCGLRLCRTCYRLLKMGNCEARGETGELWECTCMNCIELRSSRKIDCCNHRFDSNGKVCSHGMVPNTYDAIMSRSVDLCFRSDQRESKNGLPTRNERCMDNNSGLDVKEPMCRDCGTAAVSSCDSTSRLCQRATTSRNCECERSSTTRLQSDISEVRTFPEGYLECQQCVICLDSYVDGSVLCGLPCGHSFHEECILRWLCRDHHFCPVCRWPSNKAKTHFHYE